MNRTDFSKSCPGRLVRTVGDGWAYVPNPLPPLLDWDEDFAGAVSEAGMALGRLDGAGAQLQNPNLLIAPFVRREAVLSSRIEGTQTLLPDLLEFEADPEEVERRTPDVREVVNYVWALEYGLERLKELPLNLRLIRELHERLMSGLRGGDRDPGHFRRAQNLIGPPDCHTPDQATFVPPPPNELQTTLREFEAFMHAPSKAPPLVRLAMIHYQFEAIHPFLDGNGRVGRLLISLWLSANKLLSQPLLYLSAYFESRREAYYDLLLQVSLRGAWVEWIRFFVNGIKEQADDAVQRSSRLLELQKSFRDRLHKLRGSARVLGMADRLFESPYTTVSRAQKQLDVTYSGAQKIIDKLVTAKILKEITGRARNRVYVAQEIVKAIDD